MKTFKVLGSGCKKCNTTAELIAQKSKDLNIEVVIEKVTDMGDILGYGVMSTPGLIVDEKLVHSGSVPSAGQVEKWIKS